MTIQLPDLTRFGNIPSDYVHRPKIAVPGEDVALSDGYLKWYDVRPEEAEIPEQVRAEAREFLHAESEAGRLKLDGDLGFVVFHLCGESFYFLIVLTWRNQNEMWETLYGQDVAKGGGFQLIPQGTHLEVICVWELGAVVHERQAWTQYLLSARDEQAKIAYLTSRYSGPV
ncbi:hypothetical protein [Jatrophihabitans sp.]|uniref:hypothetical protein n=1 Tax=Jatrophihabitans sp. TaxID=1932789 RepID=UPI002BD352E3|nr:hypothetical protein [Jatrophihabitans sp.]